MTWCWASQALRASSFSTRKRELVSDLGVAGAGGQLQQLAIDVGAVEAIGERGAQGQHLAAHLDRLIPAQGGALDDAPHQIGAVVGHHPQGVPHRVADPRPLEGEGHMAGLLVGAGLVEVVVLEHGGHVGLLARAHGGHPLGGGRRQGGLDADEGVGRQLGITLEVAIGRLGRARRLGGSGGLGHRRTGRCKLLALVAHTHPGGRRGGLRLRGPGSRRLGPPLIGRPRARGRLLRPARTRRLGPGVGLARLRGNR
jgi:hypothetical protein